MKIFLSNALFVIFFFIASQSSYAGDADDAAKAASEILSNLQSKSYENVWNSQTSQFFKERITKDSFLANMLIGRQSFGAITEKAQFIDMSYAKEDPGTNTKGEIYSFNFITSYSLGRFYERIVVIKEQDNKFRLAGLWGAPAPAAAPKSSPQ